MPRRNIQAILSDLRLVIGKHTCVITRSFIIRAVAVDMVVLLINTYRNRTLPKRNVRLRGGGLAACIVSTIVFQRLSVVVIVRIITGFPHLRTHQHLLIQLVLNLTTHNLLHELRAIATVNTPIEIIRAFGV